jgi:hypothetical protein
MSLGSLVPLQMVSPLRRKPMSLGSLVPLQMVSPLRRKPMKRFAPHISRRVLYLLMKIGPLLTESCMR